MNEPILSTNIDPAPSEMDLDQLRGSIRESLEKTDKGGTANTISNCVTIYEQDPTFAGKISRNQLTETDDIIGPMPWPRVSTRFDDQDLPHVLLHFEQYYGIRSEKCIQHAFRVVACRNGFHPIRNYLNGLTWDGVPRVREALHHFLGAEVSDYNETCLRLFMIGAVKRVFEPGCKFELMLVLTGGQGAGKSTFLRFLAIRDEWFSDDLKRLEDEKIYQRLAGHWILEMSEMVATANAKSIEDIKSFLSRNKDTYKFPYDRYAADHLRQCVFAGTTNKTDFLPMDRSGNRRFLPVQVHPEQAETHILTDEASSRAYIEQMWAEIMADYRAGRGYTHLSKEMERKLAREQEAFQQEDPLAGQIYSYMESFPGDKLCSKQIYHEGLNHPGVDPKQWETREIYEIVNTGIAKGILPGWRPFTSSRRFEKYGTQRGWERVPPAAEETPTIKSADSLEQMGFLPVTPDEDFPF